MADIVNTEAIRYANEIVRPLAEEMRALDYRIQAALTTWYATIAAVVPVDADAVLQDGREADGVSRLTGNDINLLVAQLAAYKTAMDGAGVRNVIAKPTVRALTVI